MSDEPICQTCGYQSSTEADLILHQHVRHNNGGLLPLHLACDPTSVRAWGRLNPDEKRIRIRNQWVQRLTNFGRAGNFINRLGKPINIYMDEFCEVWLTTRFGKNKGEKKICAAGVASKTNALCTLPAGFGTTHLNYGRCKWHMGACIKPLNRGADMQSAFLQAYMNRPYYSLMQSLERIDKLSSKELYSTETNLRLAYTLLDQQMIEGGMMQECLQCGAKSFVKYTRAEMVEIRGTMRLIDRIQRTDAEIRSKLIIEPLAIMLFVQGIMDIIMPYIRRDERVEVAEQIFNNVLLPLGDKKSLAVKDFAEIEDIKIPEVITKEKNGVN